MTCYDEFAAAMAEPEPPFPIAKDVIEGYFDPGETPLQADGRPAGGRVQESPADEPMGDGFTPHFNKLKFCALAGVHFLYRRGWSRRSSLPSARRWPICPTHLRLRGQGACDAGAGRGDGSKDQAVCEITATAYGAACPAPALYGKRAAKARPRRACPAPTNVTTGQATMSDQKRSSGESFAGNVMKYSVATYLGFAITGLALIVKGCCPLRCWAHRSPS